MDRTGRRGRDALTFSVDGARAAARRLFVDIGGDRRPSRTFTVAVFACVPLAALVILQRPVDGNATKRFWAEDGSVFYQGALQHGCGAVLDGYAGYGHFVPRLLSCGIAHLPVSAAATAYGVTAALLASLFAAAAAYLATAVTGSRLVGVVAALAVLLSPIAEFECLDAVCNVQWFVPVAIFWALLSIPGGRAQTVAVLALVALGVASASLTVLFAPLVLVRILALGLRPRRDPVSWAFAVGALYQGVIIVASLGERPPSPRPAPWAALRAIGARLLVGWPGPTQGESFYRDLGWGFAAFVLVALVAAVVRLLRNPERRPVAIALLGCGLLLLVFPLVYSWQSTMEPHGTDPSLLGAGRYAVSPLAMLLSLALFALPAARTTKHRHARVGAVAWPAVPVTAAAASLMVLGTVGVVRDFHGGHLRALGPTWAQDVVQGRDACRASDAPRETTVPIAPTFTVVLPCSKLL